MGISNIRADRGRVLFKIRLLREVSLRYMVPNPGILIPTGMDGGRLAFKCDLPPEVFYSLAIMKLDIFNMCADGGGSFLGSSFSRFGTALVFPLIWRSGTRCLMIRCMLGAPGVHKRSAVFNLFVSPLGICFSAVWPLALSDTLAAAEDYLGSRDAAV